MLLNVVVATGIVVDIEVAVVVATTSKAADVEATMVVAEAIPHSTTMAAAETITLKAAAAGTISSSNNAKEGVDVVVQDQMLSARYVAEMDIPRSDVGNASTKTFKDQNGLLEWW
jgi:putative ubiquitin-RnfH superfamily antitoxin RatB of RatAB toxin-antitoxin module